MAGAASTHERTGHPAGTRAPIRRCRRLRGALPALLLLIAGTGPSVAQEPAATPAPGITPSLSIELNRLEDVDGGCRLSFVLTNGLAAAVEALSIEAVLFDPGGRVERFLLLKARPLPRGRTRVQQFDVAGAACAGIGSILLNDVTACAGEGLDPPACLEAIRPASRAAVPFGTALAPPAGAAAGD